MSEDLVKTLRDISEQAEKSVEAARSVGDPHQLSASIGRWGELFGQAAEALSHLKAENERLKEALTRIATIEHDTTSEMCDAERGEIFFNFVVCASIIAAEALTGRRQTYPVSLTDEAPVSREGALQYGPEGKPLASVIHLKMREIEDIIGSDPWVTRSPGEAANYLAGYVQGLEEAAAMLANFKIPEQWATTGGFQEGWHHACIEAVSALRTLNAANSQTQIEERSDEVAAADRFAPDPSECGVLREEIAAVVEVVARDGLPGPRDLDVALDAIMCSVTQWAEDVDATRKYLGKHRERDRNPKGGDGEAGSVEDESPVPEGNSPNVSAAGGEGGLTHKSPSDPHQSTVDGRNGIPG